MPGMFSGKSNGNGGCQGLLIAHWKGLSRSNEEENHKDKDY